VIEVADDQDAADTHLFEQFRGVCDGGLRVESFGVDEDGMVRDAGFDCGGLHGGSFVCVAVAGAAGKYDFVRVAGEVERTAGADAVGQCVGHAAVLVDACAEYDNGVGPAAVIGLAEAEHLCDREGDCAKRQHEDGGEAFALPAARRPGHDHRYAHDFHCHADEERKRNPDARRDLTASKKHVEHDDVVDADGVEYCRQCQGDRASPA